MPFVGTAVPSRSHRSWYTIASNLDGSVIVQKRTAEGLEKNKSVFHRIAYKKIDLVPYRIITLEIERGKDGNSGVTTRYIIAAAETEAEILEDWKRLREEHSADSANLPQIRPSEWRWLFQRIRSSMDRASVASLCITEHNSIPPVELDESTALASPLPRVSPANFGDTRQESITLHPPATEAEKLTVRVLRAWHGTNIFQRVLLLCLFLHGMYHRWMNLPAAVALVAISGYEVPKSTLRRNEVDQLLKIRRWVDTLEPASPNKFRSKICAFIVLGYCWNVVAIAIWPNAPSLFYLCESLAYVLIIFTLVAGFFWRSNEMGDISSSSHAVQNQSEVQPAPQDPECEAASQSDFFHEILDHTLAFRQSSEWRLKSVEDGSGISWFERPSPYCSHKACKFQMIVPDVTPATVANVIMNDQTDVSNTRIDPTIVSREVVMWSKGLPVYRDCFRPSTNRKCDWDTAYYVITGSYLGEDQQKAYGLWIPDEDLQEGRDSNIERCVFVQAARDCEAYHEQVGYHRCRCHISGYVARRAREGTMVEMVMSFDPCGAPASASATDMNSEHWRKMINLRKLLLGCDAGEGPRSPVESGPSLFETMVSRTDAVRSNDSGTSCHASQQSGARVLPRIVVDCIHLVTSTDWRLVMVKDGIVFFDKTVPWCGVKACRFKMHIMAPVTVRHLDEFLCDIKNSFKFDRLLVEKKKLRDVVDEQSGCRARIVHSKYKSPLFGVGARDSVTKAFLSIYLTKEEQVSFGLVPRRIEESDNPVVFISAGSDAEDAFPPVSGFVRSRVHRLCFIGKQVPTGGIDVEMVFSLDPGGLIPAAIINTLNGEQIEKMRAIRVLLLTAARSSVNDDLPGV